MMQRYYILARLDVEMETEDNRAFGRRREINRRPSLRAKYFEAPKLSSCMLQSIKLSQFLVKGKMDTRKSQAETELICSLEEPEVPATRSRRIYLENLRATARMLHSSCNLDAPPIPPVAPHTPFNLAPELFPMALRLVSDMLVDSSDVASRDAERNDGH